MKYYNLSIQIPNYYGKNNPASLFFMGNHRYTGKSLLTANQGSAMLFDLDGAEKEKKKLLDMGEEYTIVECNESIQQDLRCLFI